MSKPGPSLSCLLPQGPVLSPGARFVAFGRTPERRVDYSVSEGLTMGDPLLPWLPFGVSYALDLVFMTQHPSWNMHEYALLESSRGPVWLMKDAREGTMEQTIIADLPDIEDWLPEVPIRRRRQPVSVQAEIDARRVRVALDYVNWDGERTEVTFDGRFPRTARPRRNSSTMRHSVSSVVAVLDLSHQDLAWSGGVVIGGQRQRLATVFGVPVRAALLQTQGGVATGTFVQRAGGIDILTPSGHVARRLTERRTHAGGLELTQRDEERTLGADFVRGAGEAWELRHMWARQQGQSAAAFSLELSPPLPDLRRRFAGVQESSFVMDVGGQPSHAMGTVAARWTDEGPEVVLRPAAPWWVWDRPLRSVMRPEVDGVSVRVSREPTVGEPPSHRRCACPKGAARAFPSGVPKKNVEASVE